MSKTPRNNPEEFLRVARSAPSQAPLEKKAHKQNDRAFVIDKAQLPHPENQVGSKRLITASPRVEVSTRASGRRGGGGLGAPMVCVVGLLVH